VPQLLVRTVTPRTPNGSQFKQGRAKAAREVRDGSWPQGWPVAGIGDSHLTAEERKTSQSFGLRVSFRTKTSRFQKSELTAYLKHE